MEDKIDNKNLESEKLKISTNSSTELKSNEIFIQQNKDCSNDSDLESEIERCQEILCLEKKVQDNSNLDISIEKNNFENQVEKFCMEENFQTDLNFSNNENKTSLISMQSDNYTELHVSDKQNQTKNFLENSNYLPERKRIKLTTEDLNFNNNLEISIKTKERLDCTGNIPDKFILINSNSINLVQNKSLNLKTQNNLATIHSFINDNNLSANSSNDNESLEFTLRETKKKIMEDEYQVKNDLKLKSIPKHIERTDSTNSKGENELRRDSCETNFSGDTLILHYEESDIDSEIEKCNELLSQNSSENFMCSELNSHKVFQNYNYSDPNDNSEKVVELKDNCIKFEEANINNSNGDLLFEINNQCETNSVDSILILSEGSDIEYELQKCNELLNPLIKSEIIAIDEDSQACNNSVHMKNNEKGIEDSKIIAESIEYQVSSELQNEVFTLNEKCCEKEIKTYLEAESASFNELSQEETQGHSEIQNIVTLDDKSASKVCHIDKKDVFTNLTPQKHRPERIFKLAMKSINNSSIENINLIAKSNNSSFDQNNNSLSLRKLNDKEISKQISKDGTAVTDYFEDEKDDITNPEWQTVKNLSTNEERYQQVRKCWKSRTVPDPNKNLTYHSYKKRLFHCSSHNERSIKQHKRHASSSLPDRDAKRPCTFFLDKEIDSIKKSKDIQKQEIINEMHDKINSVEGECFSREKSLQDWSYCNTARDFYNHSHHPLDRLNNKVTNITDKYNRIVDTCENSFRNKIYALNERRNEVLKFYSFYKGLNKSNDDPTYLTESQFQELDEIENIYKQFDHYYTD